MNNNETNNELNSISLGSMNPNMGDTPLPINEVPTPAPLTEEMESEVLSMEEPTVNNVVTEPIPEVNNIPPVTPISDIPPVPPVSNPIPPIEQPIINNPIPPMAPINYPNSNPYANDIGSVPPKDEKASKKKNRMNKLLFVIIVVLALAAVGVGVYILLHLSQNTPIFSKVTVKNVQIEVGEDAPTDISYYANFKHVDASTCSLDTTNITDTKTLNAKYNFTIKCADKTYTGEASIVDTIKPKVETKDVTIGMNANITAMDFIANCDDKTTCSYAFKNENEVLNNIKTSGEYSVTILVQDEAKNSTEATAKLTVTNVAPADIYVVCTNPNNNAEVTKYGIVATEFNKSAIRTYTFTLDEATYNNLKTTSTDLNNVTYQDVTGSGTFDDSTHTLTIQKILTNEDLTAEFSTEVPTNVGELRNFFTDKGYSCTIGY